MSQKKNTSPKPEDPSPLVKKPKMYFPQIVPIIDGKKQKCFLYSLGIHILFKLVNLGERGLL